ncbi:MAG: NAD(P)-binding domain-containing protein [Clostridia bacterium]
MNKYDVGVITDAELGCNLAFNLCANGYSAVLFNTALENMMREQINDYISGIQEMGILASTSAEMTVNLLKKPRILFIVSRSGIFADEILKELYELAEAEDIIVDTCDANYKITASRCRQFEKKHIEYMGAGFSGGEAEALDGMSIMAGGSLDAYNRIYEMLSCISSKYDGFPCCAYMGPDGAGQYVKMIHNGIEYGVMQSLSEAVSILKRIAGCERTQLCETIHEWGTGDNESYLIQAVYDILNKKETETDTPMLALVSDKVKYSKSVVWLCSSAAELSVPIPSIYAALNQRFLSGLQKERAAFSGMTGGLRSEVHIVNDQKKSFLEDVKNSLYLCVLCIYTQAFTLLQRASDLYIWGTDPLDAAVTFQGGSFIRGRILSRVIDAFRSREGIKCLFEDPYFTGTVKRYSESLRRVAGICAEAGVPIPVFYASLSYVDTYASAELDTGLIELMRDYIQATGFEKKTDDKKRFHADWKDIRDAIACDEIK